MSNFLLILVITYNLNLIINAYIEVFSKVLTLFNYKNAINLNFKNAFNDIINYSIYKNYSISKSFVLFT